MATFNKDPYFPFKQYRFDTTNHPVRQSTEACRAKIQTKISATERNMIDGLCNTFQCSEGEAIRIALSEVPTRACEAVETYLRYSDPLTKEQGYSSRLQKLVVKLPLSEKQSVIDKAALYGITEKEAVRLAIVWFAKELRADRITRIAKARLIGQEKLKRQWQAENPDHHETTIPGIKAAIKRNNEIKEERREAAQEAYDERDAYLRYNPEVGRIMTNMGMSGHEIADAASVALEIEAIERREAHLQGLEGDTLKEAFIAYELSQYPACVDADEALLAAEAAFEGYLEEHTDTTDWEEMEDMISDMLGDWSGPEEPVIPRCLKTKPREPKTTNEERLASYLRQTNH